jgi:hypothetical protein
MDRLAAVSRQLFDMPVGVSYDYGQTLSQGLGPNLHGNIE